MSQQSSDSIFGSVDFQAAEPTEGYNPADEAVYAAEPAPSAYRKRSFDIYSMMLILSFIFLTTAAILFFMDVEKY